MTYGEMMQEMIKKYGVDSREVTQFKLMWISYKSGGKITYPQIKSFYKQKIGG